MQEQLQEAFPIHTYPHVFVMPDGGVVVSAGSTLVGTGGPARSRAAGLAGRPGMSAPSAPPLPPPPC